MVIISQFRGVSDFDTTHQMTANWIADLPSVESALGRNVGRGLDAIIGGCRSQGLAVDERFRSASVTVSSGPGISPATGLQIAPSRPELFYNPANIG